MNASVSNDQFLKELQLNKYFDLENEFDFDIHKRLIFWGVKSLGYESTYTYDAVSTDEKLYLYHFITHMIDSVTPNQLMTIFPITKEYDGQKYEMKDYFYTMKKCQEHGLDKEIGNSFDFLWDYYNSDIGSFVVNYLSTLSDFNKAKTGQGLMETYLAEIGTSTYSEKVVDGKSVFVENLTFNSRGELV